MVIPRRTRPDSVLRSLLILTPALASMPTEAGGISTQDVVSPSLPQATVEAIESVVVRKMTENGIPGLFVAIALDGKLVWARGFGFADLEQSVPATARTAYRSASIGKPMTATAAMQLAERGVLDLEAPIQRYCPAFPPNDGASRRVTC